MSTYTQIIYQIVFSTKSRAKVLINIENRRELFKFIFGVLKNNNCHVYRINGVEDHLHIVTHIHPTKSIANLVKDIKLGTTDYIKKQNLFPYFEGWQEGYGAFTYSIKEKDILIEYVKNQEEHHKKIDFKEEYSNLLKEHNINFEDKYL